ncbi:class I adenylate-forming enzyme family protein [Actinosynnema sp. NPDC051121]
MPGEVLHDLLDRRADATGDAPAVSVGDRTVTHAELRDLSVRLAGWLSARGVGRGDRVALVLPPSIELVGLIYAVSRVGAAFSVLHDEMPDRVRRHVLADLEPRLVITEPPAVDVEPATAALDRPEPGDPVCLIYTSGSTALPKAVVGEHRQVVFAAGAIQAELGYRPDDVVLAPLPLSFDYGLYQLFLGALSGAHVRFGSRVDGGAGLLGALLSSRATVLAAMPAMAPTLLWLLRRHRGEPPAMRMLTTTGAAMPASAAAALRRALPRLDVRIMYGLTECKRVSIMPAGEAARRPGSSGRPLPGTVVRVLDPDGAELRPGEVGELVVRGPHVMAGYWRREELTGLRFRPDGAGGRELRTGDYGWLDEDGYVYVQGRRDDVYKERGFRVSTTEIEAAAAEVPGVRLAAVLPPSEDRPRAVLVVAGSVQAGAVLEELRNLIEPFKVPNSCHVLEQLPLSANGKVDRAALAALLASSGELSIPSAR